MKLGGIIYLIPFFFVLDPSLILNGAPIDIARSITLVVIGMTLMICALQAYVPWFGSLSRLGMLAWAARLTLFVAGLAISTPSNPLLGLMDGVQPAVAVGALVLSLAFLLLGARANPGGMPGKAE